MFLTFDGDANGNDNDPILNLILDPGAGSASGQEKSNANGQRVVDCPQSFSNHHNEADSYNGRDDEKSVRIKKWKWNVCLWQWKKSESAMS